MELPQHRALGTESSKGRKATHDFLSLYSSSSDQQDPIPPHSQGKYVKTHDFLQPLERKNAAGIVENPAAQSAPKPHSSVVEHMDKYVAWDTTVRTDDSSNGGSYLGSSSTFSTIWQEHKGKTRKENVASAAPLHLREASLNWAPSSDLHRKHDDSTFGPLFPSSQASSSQNFVNMVTSAKNGQADKDDEELAIKKEPTSQSKGNMRVKVEGKTLDQRPNTPRSKHSATEQRRRSKINDRFQKLREIIPNSDQRRDKASFLFEVIEYVQFLQEKVNRYESSYSAWNSETSKAMQWSKNYTNTAAATNPVKLEDDGKNTGGGSDNNTASLNTSKEKDNQPQSPRTNMNQTDKTTSLALSPAFHQQDTAIESGTINVSSAYSRGLLNTFTEALQGSGVDLSQARISVQIDLGKRLDGGNVTAEKRLKTSASN